MLRKIFNLGRADIDAALAATTEVRHVSSVTYLQEKLLREGLDEIGLAARARHYRPRVLNIGAGSWNISAQVIEFDHTFFALDLERRGDVNERFVLGDGQVLPFRDSCFDLVICLEVVEHVESAHHLIREIKRVLDSGGNLILTAPFIQPYHEEPSDYRRFTSYGLNSLLESSGFKVCSMSHRGSPLTLIQHGMSCILLGILRVLLLPKRVRFAFASITIGSFGRLRLFTRASPKSPHGMMAVAEKPKI